jgi:hypothetical protein
VCVCVCVYIYIYTQVYNVRQILRGKNKKKLGISDPG